MYPPEQPQMKRNLFQPLTCGSVDHRIHRRMFLQGLAATSLLVRFHRLCGP
jgi:hypothetical protein